MERGQGCHILPAGWATLVHKTLPPTLLSLSRLKVGDELEDAFVATCDLRTSKKILRHQRYSHLTRDTVWTVKFEKKVPARNRPGLEEPDLEPDWIHELRPPPPHSAGDFWNRRWCCPGDFCRCPESLSAHLEPQDLEGTQ